MFRTLLEPAATDLGVSFEYQFLAPGTEPHEKAFQLLMPGADLLLQLAEAQTFPAPDQRAQSKGARRVRKSLTDPGTQRALSFMTQAIPTILARVRADDRDFQLEMRDLVQAHRPLTQADVDALTACDAEFEVMDTHELREETRLGVELGTDYHMKIEAGEDPDADAETVERQEMYARDFFLLSAQRHALALMLAERWEALEPTVERPGSTGYESLTLGRLRLLALRQIAAIWDNFTSPEPLPYGEAPAG